MNAPVGKTEKEALERNRYIGEPVARPNGRRLVEGKARYVDDLRLPLLAHVDFVRSPHASA